MVVRSHGFPHSARQHQTHTLHASDRFDSPKYSAPTTYTGTRTTIATKLQHASTLEHETNRCSKGCCGENQKYLWTFPQVSTAAIASSATVPLATSNTCRSQASQKVSGTDRKETECIGNHSGSGLEKALPATTRSVSAQMCQVRHQAVAC